MRTSPVAMILLAAIVGLSFASTATQAATPVDCLHPVGEWQNEFASTLKIESVDPKTGALRGGYGIASLPDVWFAVTGWLSSGAGEKHTVASVFTFAVRFGQAGSVTSWSGTCNNRNGKPTLSTLLHMARPSSPNPWDHIATSAETFTPQ
jgi:hypothetical protein